MEERRQIPRLSGLPRPTSRLPVFSSAPGAANASSIPAPVANMPASRNVPLRAKPSRESLAGGDLCNPKLRSVPSRDHLGAGSPSPASPNSGLTVPKNQTRRASPRTRAVSGEFAKAVPRARGSFGVRPSPSAPRLNDDSNIFGKPAASGSLSRRSSAQYLRQPNHTFSPTPDDNNSISEEGDVVPSSLRPSASPSRSSSRLSLAERTAETLSNISSSPSMKGKTTAFYDPEAAARSPSQRPGSCSERPSSRTGPSGSRPTSGLGFSDNSSPRSSSRPPSRPMSSSSRDESAPGFRATTISMRSGSGLPSFLPIDEVSTPGRTSASTTRSLRGRSSIGPGTTISPRYASLGSLRQQADASSLQQPRPRTPSSPDKSSSIPATTPSRSPAPGTFGSKTATARPLKSRASTTGLVRKPSATNLDGAASSSVAASAATRKNSLASRASSMSYEDNSASNVSTASTAASVNLADSGSTVNSRKSSAALREQIAKAKAAKRVAAQQAASDNSVKELGEPELEPSEPMAFAASFSASGFSSAYGLGQSPVIPTDNTFDFGLSSDPFNQNRSGDNQSKVIQARVAAARTSGRLNIAALNLREIPADVMNMYEADAMGTFDGSWAETVDLTRFVAADNEFEMIDESVFPDISIEEMAEQEDSKGNIFGGLETLDLHGNILISLPMGLRRLPVLTSLNLSQNRITNNALEVISQITSLRDLKLGGNLFYGPLDPCFAKLENLEIADLHGNNISALPLTLSNMSKLRILNISENNFESLVFEPLSKLPLTELNVRKNKLKGVLIEDVVAALPSLQILDVTSNQITHLVSATRTEPLSLPAIQQLLVSMNRLQSLPDMTNWTTLLTLIGEENNINSIPDGFTGLRNLGHADFSSNEIRVIPSEIGRMEKLAMLRLSGNPLRDKKFCTAETDEIKEILASRLEPEVEELEDEHVTTEMQDELRDAVTEMPSTAGDHGRTRSRKLSSASVTGRGEESEDDFATPPTSAPHSPARSRSQTVSNQIWPVKNGGILDRSETESSSLHPVIASRVAQEHTVFDIRLYKNLFTTIPDALSFFATTLTSLSLSKNQLKGEDYLGDASTSDGLDLPALKELNLSSNYITGLGPLVRHVRAPSLQKLDVSMNRVSSLPPDTQLRDAFPNLTVLLAGNNHLADLNPESIKGMRVVDVSNNDIDHLNPRLGLLGGDGGLQRFEVLGNRFRVPRFNVIERGTDATLRWLRGRVPVAEMGAWREANRQKGGDVDDELD